MKEVTYERVESREAVGVRGLILLGIWRGWTDGQCLGSMRAQRVHKPRGLGETAQVAGRDSGTNGSKDWLLMHAGT